MLYLEKFTILQFSLQFISMKYISIVFVVFLSSCANTYYKLDYNSRVPAVEKIQSSLSYAKSKNKYLLLHIGNNDCRWSQQLQLLYNKKPLKKFLKKNFILQPIIYSKAIRNEAVISSYDRTIESIPHIFLLNSNAELINSISLSSYQTIDSYDVNALLNELTTAITPQ
jgi:thioredoxin-related protein